MKTSGINEVESWEDLSKVSNEKLVKLRDVARDNERETFSEYMDARQRTIDIQMELTKRGIVKSESQN